MSEIMGPGDPTGKEEKKIGLKTKMAHKVATGAAIAAALAGTNTAAGCVEKSNFSEKADATIEKLANPIDMDLVKEMTAGTTEKIKVAKWGEQSDDPEAVTTVEALRNKAGWDRRDEASFTTALGILNGSAFNEQGDLMPGVYEVPVSTDETSD